MPLGNSFDFSGFQVFFITKREIIVQISELLRGLNIHRMFMNTANVLAITTTASTTNTYMTLSILALSNKIATSHMELFQFKLVQVK